MGSLCECKALKRKKADCKESEPRIDWEREGMMGKYLCLGGKCTTSLSIRIKPSLFWQWGVVEGTSLSPGTLSF